MVSKIVCIFVCGHLSLWKDVLYYFTTIYKPSWNVQPHLFNGYSFNICGLLKELRCTVQYFRYTQLKVTWLYDFFLDIFHKYLKEEL